MFKLKTQNLKLKTILFAFALLTAALPAFAATPKIAAGAYHTVVLKADGTVVAWGTNGSGQLGDGTTTQHNSPVAVPGLTGVVAVAAGFDHTVALKGDGTVVAWGDNRYGQLGDGSTTNSSSPVAVPGLTGVSAVSAGIRHTVALKADGTVVAWGYNSSGQLGDGTTTNHLSPVAVPGLSGVAAVAAGSYYTMAHKADGTVVAWGDNQMGELGDGTTTSRLSPVVVPGLTGVVSVSATNQHTVALKADGTVVAWGSNGYGQLGDGTTTQRLSPVVVPGLTGVVAVAAGGVHTVALKADGTVVAWGFNGSGEVGDGTTTQRLNPVVVPGLTGVSAVSAGIRHTVALKADGTVVAWGDNNVGQLGDGTIVNKSSPVQITTIGTNWAKTAAGGSHTLSLKSDGTLWAWGRNNYGQLGDGTTVDKTSPIQIGTDNKWVSIGAGDSHTVSLKSDGTLWAWGRNNIGQLGDGTGVDKTSPVQIGIDNKWVSIEAGLAHTVALKSDGTLWAWGNNGNGQLGDGTLDHHYVPLQTGTDNKWVSIAAGYYHTLALKSDGTLWAWGGNVSGQLGNGDGTTIPKNSPIQITTIAYIWSTIAGGDLHTLSLKSDGTLWAWGNNGYGQLGDGTTVNKTSPVQIGIDNKWVSISAVNHTLSLKSDGTLWAWGNNGYGQLGDGTTVNKTSPVQIGASDTTPPTGTISINSGAASTNSTSTTLTLSCTDASGCAQMQFSNDNTTWSTAETYTTSKAWTLASGDGTKTVYVKFKDTAGNWSTATISDTIVLDTTAPTTTASPAGGTYTSAQSVTLTCSDGTGSGCDKIYYTTNGTTPTTSSTVYSSPISISATTTLKFFAKDLAGNSEAVKTAVYTISATTIQLPRTGQTTSYAAGDDGDVQAGVVWPSPRFTDNEDGTVTDNLTGLMWTKNANCMQTNYPSFDADSTAGDGSVTWQHALDFVSGINSTTYITCGSSHTDWRLPNRKELLSLLDFSQASPGLPAGHPFLNVAQNYYWSSTTDARYKDRAWDIGTFGQIYGDSKTNNYYRVWPVRATTAAPAQLPETGQTACYDAAGSVISCAGTGQDGEHQAGVTWPSPRFTNNGNGTITDNLTDLTWTQDGQTPAVGSCSSGAKTWQGGLDYITCLNTVSHLGHSDWRMPNINEFESIINAEEVDAATWLKTQGFINDLEPAIAYWLSTTYAFNTNNALRILTDGTIYSESKTGSGYIWPVRGGLVTDGGGDTTPPTGSISINSGAESTNSTSATLTLSCTDASGCSQMQFSNDNTNWSTPETYGTPKTWNLSSGDGTKTVYVKFKDTAGNWSTAYNDTITLTTLDAPPTKPANIDVSQNGVKGQLLISWSNPSDADFNHIHIYRSTASGTLGTLIADNLTGIKYTDTGLASLTTYYYTVRAVDNAGNESTNTNATANEYGYLPKAKTLDATPPAVPTGVTATDATTGGKINLSWTNPTDSDFSMIKIYRSTEPGTLGSAVFIGVATSYSNTGLTNGVTYYYTVRAIDTSSNETTNTTQVSATPTAPDTVAPAVPTTTPVVNTTAGGTLTISWTNPVDGDFAFVRIYRSTTSGQLGTLVYDNVTGTSKTDTGLTNNATYYYTIRSVDTAGNESTNTNQISGTPTDIQVPVKVTGLTTTLLADGKIRLDWTRSASADVNYYNIYYDNGTGTINYIYANKIGSVAHPAVTWTSGNLTVGTAYKFAVRAEDTAQNEEPNTSVVASAVPVTNPNAGDVKGYIKVPQTGQKINGNRVTVVADILTGASIDVKDMRFQYKPASSGSWTDITPADPAFPNPDTTNPWFTHWDVTGLATGDYLIRAIATNVNLTVDSNPSYITVTVSDISPEVTESVNQKTQDVSANTANTVSIGTDSGITQVTIPESAISSDTKVNVSAPDPSIKNSLVPSGYGKANEFREITLDSGQTELSSSKEAEMIIPYDDANNDNIVDGTTTKVYDLKVMRYNTTTSAWEKLDSVVDTTNKVVKGKTNHFTLFGLLAPPNPTSPGWNIVAVPLNPSPNSASSVFGQTPYVYNPTTNGYDRPSTIQPGIGYWIKGGANLTASGTETPTTGNFSITLKKGWNMIGNPFRFNVNLSDCKVLYSTVEYTMADAETNGYLIGTVYPYINGVYQFINASDGGELEPWIGYWILSDKDMTLLVPPTPAQ